MTSVSVLLGDYLWLWIMIFGLGMFNVGLFVGALVMLNQVAWRSVPKEDEAPE
jgi:hypothetical protein